MIEFKILYICVYLCMCAYVYIYVCVCKGMCLYVYMDMCVHMDIYLHIWRNLSGVFFEFSPIRLSFCFLDIAFFCPLVDQNSQVWPKVKSWSPTWEAEVQIHLRAPQAQTGTSTSESGLSALTQCSKRRHWLLFWNRFQFICFLLEFFTGCVFQEIGPFHLSVDTVFPYIAVFARNLCSSFL